MKNVANPPKSRQERLEELQRGVERMKNALAVLQEENKRLMKYAVATFDALKKRMRDEHQFRMNILTSIRQHLENCVGARPLPRMILVDNNQLDILRELKGTNGDVGLAILRARRKRQRRVRFELPDSEDYDQQAKRARIR